MNNSMYVDGAQPVIEAQRAFVQAANRLPTLFDLENSACELLALLDDNPDSTEVEAQLGLIDQMLLEKTESYVSVIRSLEAMAEARKVEADRLSARAKTAQRHADWLRARLLAHMQSTERLRIETSRFTLTVRQNPVSCTVLDASKVPSEFQRTKIEMSVDRRSILDAFKATGEIPPGVDIVRTERLEVK